MTKKWIYVIAGFIIILIIAVIWMTRQGRTDQTLQAVHDKPEVDLSAWIVDWKWESGLADFQQIAGNLSRLQMFAVYFDSKDRLYFTEDFQKGLPRIFETARKENMPYVDLTVVNDRWNEDGTAVQKDPAIVSRIMATKESRAQHIKEIMNAVNKYDFDGVEIDYEKIGEADWENVCIFYKELYQQLQAKEKSLRVILEPRTPIERLRLPEGPVYVMMAYNLFGNHSGPGPKADHAFIAKLASRMEQLPGENAIALSVGGFDWADSGQVKSLTEKQAVELLQQSKAEPKRDAASGCLYFTYKDSSGEKHTVWYADAETITQWIDVAGQSGYYNFVLWRLGEFEKVTLDKIKHL
ncbi:glycosyl hydrolase family 18 protein [Paenibacillus fonticola]|uniref:glycosyl hydrolase family 18 protein n=1 Tax=Paenibacillus fonticola TaxID=379896 RepID=UPI00037F0146|nr:glycosyl hydrolase family 18 protein [Paenibacillus fonticola]